VIQEPSEVRPTPVARVVPSQIQTATLQGASHEPADRNRKHPERHRFQREPQRPATATAAGGGHDPGRRQQRGRRRRRSQPRRDGRRQAPVMRPGLMP